MELNKIERVVEKYFDGGTSSEEEKELRKYFASSDVAPHLKQYKPIFGYFSNAAGHELTQEIQVFPKFQHKKQTKLWLSIAASIVVLVIAGTYVYFEREVSSQDLGTCDNPEAAMKETQKVLTMLSSHVNVGIESVKDLEQYENSKDLIFKQ
ncbi:hypothetical protein [Flavobacterium sp. ACAM 123]|jgi:hypothetical protein|uniref:hypothetical protein n=1 Tax=Flavobacterium sp. ACAM 123 TaxID=1189620 RepID=UPI0002E724A9|nr:hypothetical protein [Flavobacterium sp. ACAM 123]